jgi:hypothetical protein
MSEVQDRPMSALKDAWPSGSERSRRCSRGRRGVLLAGLLPEQIDPGTGAFLGNYPQTFSHVGPISSAVNLARSMRGCP